jgi:hypothetical protein
MSEDEGKVSAAVEAYLTPRTDLQPNEIASLNRLADFLKTNSTQAEELFLEAYKLGAPVSKLLKIEESSTESLKQTQDHYSKNPHIMPKEMGDDLMRISPKKNGKEAAQNYNLRFKIQAVMGLGIVGGKRSEGFLEALVNDNGADPILRSASALSLKKIREMK